MSPTRKIAYTILLISFIAFKSLGQKRDTILVEFNSKILNSSIFEPYTNKWKVTFMSLDGKQSPNRIWTDYSQILNIGDKSYLLRVQDLYSPEMKLQNTWINRVELPSLKPIHFSTFTPSGGFSFFEFSDEIIYSCSNLNKEHQIRHDTTSIDGGAYDWNLYGILLAALPFNQNKVYQIPYFDTNVLEVKNLFAYVNGAETVLKLDGKKVDTWKIVTNKNLVFWLTKSPPYVIKLELDVPGKGKLVWDLY